MAEACPKFISQYDYRYTESDYRHAKGRKTGR
jgi:hypothetical protein